jgi:hypothetical protein
MYRSTNLPTSIITVTIILAKCDTQHPGVECSLTVEGEWGGRDISCKIVNVRHLRYAVVSTTAFIIIFHFIDFNN